MEEAILSPRSPNTRHFDKTLGRILNFPPLLEAFEEFCRKASCSEVRHDPKLQPTVQWNFARVCRRKGVLPLAAEW